jgi:hemolysin III
LPPEHASSGAGHVRVTLYTFGEELAHALTHGIGAVLAIIGQTVLISRAATWGHATHVIAAAVFGTSLVLMYIASTLFHAVPHPLMPSTKRILRIIDHCLVYVLIAGTYTPFTLVTLHGTWGWSLFGFTWGLAVIGIGFKLFTTGRYEMLSLAIYLLMGWCGLVAIRQIVANLDSGGLWLLLAGALSYTFGVGFYVWERLRYHHAIWHGFVLGGSVCHYFAVLVYVLPTPGG